MKDGEYLIKEGSKVKKKAMNGMKGGKKEVKIKRKEERKRKVRG